MISIQCYAMVYVVQHIIDLTVNKFVLSVISWVFLKLQIIFGLSLYFKFPQRTTLLSIIQHHYSNTKASVTTIARMFFSLPNYKKFQKNVLLGATLCRHLIQPIINKVHRYQHEKLVWWLHHFSSLSDEYLKHKRRTFIILYELYPIGKVFENSC